MGKHSLTTDYFKIMYRTECPPDRAQQVYIERQDPETGESLGSHYVEMEREHIDMIFNNKDPEGEA